METATALAMRRSQRVKLETFVTITSLLAEATFSDRCKSFIDNSVLTETTFSERCKTLVVNAQGCGVICSRALAEGTPIRMELESPKKRRVTGRILNCHPLSGNAFAVGIQMDVEGNFWALESPPPDWPIASYEEDTAPAPVTSTAESQPAPAAESKPRPKLNSWPSLSA